MKPQEILIFDADCAFCRASVVWGQKNLKYFPEAIGFQFLQPSKFELSDSQVKKSIWLVSTASETFAPIPAGRAVSKILKSQPQLAWRVLGVVSDLPLVRMLTKVAYFSVAANRHRLPGGTSECEFPAPSAKGAK